MYLTISTFMGLDFHVQLLVDNATDDSPTVIGLPSLGNALIRKVMAPLMEKHEFRGELCIPSQGELPIDVGTPAHVRLVEMHKKVSVEANELGDELERIMHGPTERDWDDVYPTYRAQTEFSNLIAVSLSAIKRASKNPAMHARIVWC